MRFLRTTSTRRLLAVLSTVVVVIAGGTAIAVAATGKGPAPARKPLAAAVHQALTAGGRAPVKGISANISFTNNLIDSSDFTGQAVDPLLQGGNGRLWLTDNGRMRLELQSNDGDAQVVVNHRSFWISDPSQNTVYEGTLPASRGNGKDMGAGDASHGVPSIARIQSVITRLMGRVDLSGAQPTDVAGRPAYRVSISPKHGGGLLGSAQLAWDALRGVPLQMGIYARGNPTPVLSLTATQISYGAVPTSDVNVSPPAGAKIVTLPATGAGANPTAPMAGRHAHAGHASGLRAVAAQVPFALQAPRTLVGLPRHSVSVLGMGASKAALVSYGQNLGGMAVIESKAKPGSTGGASHGSFDGLRLPSVSIHGATGTELSTALGTVIEFSRNGIHYTVIGSVPATAAELAARAL